MSGEDMASVTTILALMSKGTGVVDMCINDVQDTSVKEASDKTRFSGNGGQIHSNEFIRIHSSSCLHF